jgi:hypothetical protein
VPTATERFLISRPASAFIADTVRPGAFGLVLDAFAQGPGDI